MTTLQADAAIVLAAIGAGFIVSRLLQRTGLSLMIAISLSGLVIAAVLPHAPALSLGPAVLAVFLPALIFEASWDADVVALRRAAPAIAVLAGPGVLLTAAIVAGAALLSKSVMWPGALVLGALLAATDPVSVLSTFRRLRLPHVLLTIVEGESIANDGVALVLVQSLVPLAIATAVHPSVASMVGQIAVVSLGGVAVGVAIAVPIGVVMRGTVALPLRVALTILVAYLTYSVASQLALSGIFATAAAGVAMRSVARISPEAPAAYAIDRTWDGIALCANAVVFALVGLTLRVDRLVQEPLLLGCVVGGAAVARLLLAYGLVPLRGLTEAPRFWRHGIALAGLRGGLCLAIAIGLPPAVAERDQIRDAAFALVFVTLLLQGPLVAPILERLRPAEAAGATTAEA